MTTPDEMPERVARYLTLQLTSLTNDAAVWEMARRCFGAAASLVGGDPDDLQTVREQVELAIDIARTYRIILPGESGNE